jgi:hypothetical protein
MGPAAGAPAAARKRCMSAVLAMMAGAGRVQCQAATVGWRRMGAWRAGAMGSYQVSQCTRPARAPAGWSPLRALVLAAPASPGLRERMRQP